MQSKASKIKIIRTLFQPSGMGLVSYIFLMALVIFLHQIPFIEQYLQIPSGFSLFRLISGWLDTFLTTYIGQTRTETLVVGLFWAGVGLGVYMFLRGISHFATDFSEGIDERTYLWPKGVDRNRGVIEASQRTGFRVLAFVAILVITFGPVQRVLAGPLWKDFLGPNIELRLAIWFVFGIITLHIWVILLRLVLLKPRVLA